MTALKDIEARVRSLRREEKVELLRSLIAQLDGPADTDVEAAWLKAAKRRYQEILERKVKTVTAKKVFERARKHRDR